MRKFYRHYRPGGDAPKSGEDSFLDIISNMVGIMIILVMIAGVRVGTVAPEDPNDSAADPTPQRIETVAASEASPTMETASSAPLDGETASVEADRIRKTRYVQAMKEFDKIRNEGIGLKNEVDRLNEQMILVKNEADGAGAEYLGLVSDIAAAEASIERIAREKTDSVQEQAERESELRRLTEETERLRAEAERLAQIRPKATVLENMPTPLTKKVEGKEGVFALREGKISHVPIGYFAERVRGYFRSMRDMTKNRIEETMGPTDGYLFRFEGSLHRVRSDDGRMAMTVVFDEGEFIPDGVFGETWDEALRPESDFRQKLALYLRESSVITLSVYPDSFELLRNVKKYLLEKNYTIAIRPMPAGKNIVISPQGTESTTY